MDVLDWSATADQLLNAELKEPLNFKWKLETWGIIASVTTKGNEKVSCNNVQAIRDFVQLNQAAFWTNVCSTTNQNHFLVTTVTLWKFCSEVVGWHHDPAYDRSAAAVKICIHAAQLNNWTNICFALNWHFGCMWIIAWWNLPFWVQHVIVGARNDSWMMPLSNHILLSQCLTIVHFADATLNWCVLVIAEMLIVVLSLLSKFQQIYLANSKKCSKCAVTLNMLLLYSVPRSRIEIVAQFACAHWVQIGSTVAPNIQECMFDPWQGFAWMRTRWCQ